MKPFTRLAIIVLWLIALPQLLLFIASWEITLNGAPVPLWLSVLVEALAACLTVMVWWEGAPYFRVAGPAAAGGWIPRPPARHRGHGRVQKFLDRSVLGSSAPANCSGLREPDATQSDHEHQQPG